MPDLEAGQPANFGELAWRAVRLFPDKVAIEQDDVSLTYRELEERTRRVARLLRDLGVRAGERVLLMFPNDYRLPECLLGTLRAGAVAVPVNVKLGFEALAFVVEHSDAGTIIAHADLRDKLDDPHISRLRTLVVGGDTDGPGIYDERLAATPGEFTTAVVDSDDLAVLMYTSGSTGVPKGCMLSHANQWWQTRSMAQTMLWDEGDKALVLGPLYHANALWACLFPMLFLGGGVAILPAFEAQTVPAAIERYRPTYTSGTPAMFSMLLAERDALSRCDVSSIELVKCGSAPVSSVLKAALSRQFGCEVVEGYGLTEGGATVASPRWGVKQHGSSGLPVPGAEIRIADLANPRRDCSSGEVGELWTRSPANALGYFKAPEVTAARFTPDGWLRTGDLVWRNQEGFVYFSGRIDDMINCGGENVYPKEVETILLSHPEIADACVVAAEHPVKGQAPVAWVVPRARDQLAEEDVKRHFLTNGPAYAHPRRVFFVDELPVSGTSKIDRKRLEEETRRLLPRGLTSERHQR